MRATLKADAALLTRVQEILQQNKLTPDGVFLDQQSVKARFDDTETQLRAKDALQAALGDDYVVALNLLSRDPTWLSAIGALPMYWGSTCAAGCTFCCRWT